MDTMTKFGVFASSALVCLGVLFAPPISAGEQPMSLRYAGVGYDTKIDGLIPDDQTVTLTTGTAAGTLGAAEIAITAEFRMLQDAADCPAGFPVKYALVYSATVLTFKDQSQLFGFSTLGWLCANAGGGYVGEVQGIYEGGAGRFASATGDFVSKFNGAYLDPSIGFRSIRGTVEGTVGRH